MKKLFVGLLIFGTVASIVAAFFGISERNKFNRFAMEKLYERDEAVREKRSAELAERDAEKLRSEAERSQRIAESERDVSLNEAKQSNARADEADRLRQEADQVKEIAQSDRKKAIGEKEAALEERDNMVDERDKAVGRFEAEQEAREIAEKKQVEAVEAVGKANNEVADIREIGEMARRTVVFVGSFNDILFPFIDLGDSYFMKGLELFGKAKTKKDKYKAVGFIDKARDKYIEARDKLKRLRPIEGDDKTRLIVEISQESTDENIKSVDIIREVLNDMLGSNSMPPGEKQEKADEAAKRKGKADRLMVEVCEKLLAVIDTYKAGFTKTQQSQIQELKKRIENQLEIPAGETE